MAHRTPDILRQRIYGLILGHEDLNDHKRLRLDPALQAAATRDGEMVSQSTLCRLERRSSAEAMVPHGVFLDQFVAAHPVPPKRIVLDFDATDIKLHGTQERRHCHYRSHCHLTPFLVFSGRHYLAAVLQPNDGDAAWRAAAVLKLFVEALRRKWPGVEVILRGDCGCCRPCANTRASYAGARRTVLLLSLVVRRTPLFPELFRCRISCNSASLQAAAARWRWATPTGARRRGAHGSPSTATLPT